MSQYPRTLLVIVATCFFLSGFAALLYQTAWLREFSIVFGTSELAIAMVLAVYMGGLALGAAVAEPLVGRISRPVRVYGLLEAGIAGAALCVPMATDWAGSLYAAILGNQPVPPDARGWGQFLFYLVAGFLILSIPTGLMGATLPVLMRSIVREDSEIGSRAALLYGINTAGAVAGAVMAGFVLLGSFGLRGTVWVGVAVNALIFLIAATAAAVFPAVLAAPDRITAASTPTFFRDCLQPIWPRTRSWRESVRPEPAWILPVMLVSGATTFIYEVFWTRLLSHVMGSSIYAFSTMLAAFLTGIALGGGAAASLARSRRQAASAFVASQIAIAAVSLAVFAFLDQLLPPSRGLAVNVVLATSVLLPPAVCIGVTFPLAVRILCPNAELAAKCTARVYAWNTVGAIAGAIFAGFFLIPGWGFEGAIRFAVLVNLSLALAVVTLVATRSRPLSVGLLLVIVGTVIFVHPNRPDAILRSSTIVAKADAGTDLYFGVGRNSTVRLTELPHGYQLRNNGLPEAQIAPRGSPPTFVGWDWLTSLPVVARPEAQSMLVVGLGGGVALERLPPTLDEVHVVELEEEIINANRLVGEFRKTDPLLDPRVTVIVNDARNALRLTGREYDIIVSQPSQPWTPGASHLYTTEFARLAKSRLRPGGILLEWMSASNLDTALLRTLVATLADVFEHVRLYNPDFNNLIFLASDTPLDLEKTFPLTTDRMELAAHLRAVGIANREILLAALLLDKSAVEKFSASAPVSNDNRNLMAMESRYLQDGLSIPELVESISRVDPFASREFWTNVGTVEPEIDYLYLSARVAVKYRSHTRLPGMAGVIDDPTEARFVKSVYSLVSGNRNRAWQQLRKVLISDPTNQQARYALVFSQLGTLLAKTASRRLQAEADALTGVPAALLDALRHERSGEWSEVAALDDILARARPTEIWFPDVIRIRAAWRLEPGLDDRESLAAEALQMIDTALPIRTDVSMLVQRATAAAIVGNARAALESSSHVVGHVRRALDAAQTTGRRLGSDQRANLDTVANLLRTHPEWRKLPRGPTIYDFVDEVEEQSIAAAL